MKRLLLVLTCAVVLAMAAPFAAFPAHKQQGDASVVHKHHWFSFHRTHKEKQQSGKHDSLLKLPRSVGWWHHTPGPAGAGAK